MPDRAPDDKSKIPLVSRLQSLRDATKNPELNPPMPELVGGEYLIEYLFSVGPSVGEGAISYSELQCYQSLMGFDLSPWECLTLRRLSIDYINESHRAKAINCKAPWQPEENNIDNYLAALRSKEAIRSLAKM
ncbi:hypothetical protein UNDYM_1662 [Undibacterium sp. YM2]|uniref:phage tail assembly chaperone n=1 Tax=Undibacterium sp. YM2 TaxID=2058625 RepID=UPI001331F6BB|nr:hypothetical protein [Undibacterium sp. YM2]BBB65915.1 hypothetical protein UNDYM_1662 [Undibacterium sp. YM2]